MLRIRHVYSPFKRNILLTSKEQLSRQDESCTSVLFIFRKRLKIKILKNGSPAANLQIRFSFFSNNIMSYLKIIPLISPFIKTSIDTILSIDSFLSPVKLG